MFGIPAKKVREKTRMTKEFTYCKYCEHYEMSYEIACRDCIVFKEDASYTNFKWNKELKKLRKLADIGRKTKELYKMGFVLASFGIYGEVEFEIDSIEELMRF